MDIQAINLGQEVTGKGGDNYREAHTKINSNFEEIGEAYTEINGSLSDIGEAQAGFDSNLETINNELVGFSKDFADIDKTLTSIPENTGSKRNPDDRVDINTNLQKPSQGLLPYPLEQGLADNFESKESVVQQSALETGTCNIRVSTEMSSNFVAPNVPWLKVNGLSRRTVPVTFHTKMLGTPCGYPLFKPTRTNRSGFLTFKYIGDKPIYTTLKGSLDFLYLEYLKDEAESGVTIPSDVILSLRPVNPHQSEVGQGSGSRSLGAMLGAMQEVKPLASIKMFNDNFLPLSSTMRTWMATNSNFKNIYVGSDVGYLTDATTYDDDGDNFATEDGIGVVSDNVRTTKWMDATNIGIGNDSGLFVMTFEGTDGGVARSTRSRVQVKDSDGVMTYLDDISINSSSQRIYRIPDYAEQIRVYYSGRNDDVDESTIVFGALSAVYNKFLDPYYGLWTQRTLNVNRDVVFYPDTEYMFSMDSYLAGSGAVDRSWGYRFQSFNLSFDFDASAIKNEMANKLWSK